MVYDESLKFHPEETMDKSPASHMLEHKRILKETQLERTSSGMKSGAPPSEHPPSRTSEYKK